MSAVRKSATTGAPVLSAITAGRLGDLESVWTHRCLNAWTRPKPALVIDGLAMRADDGKTPRRNVSRATHSQGNLGKQSTKQEVKLADSPGRRLLPCRDAHDPLLHLGRVGNRDEGEQAHSRMILRAAQAHQGRIDSVHRGAGHQPHGESGSVNGLIVHAVPCPLLISRGDPLFS